MFKFLFALGLLATFWGCEKSIIEVDETIAGLNSEASQPTVVGVPVGESELDSVTFSVSGGGYISFIFKVGPAELTDCQVAAQYTSVDLDVTVRLDVSSLPDGPLSLCILGQYEDESWQDYTTAKQMTWLKKTGSVPSVFDLQTVSSDQKISLVWNSPVGTTGTLLIRSLVPVSWQPEDGEVYEPGTGTAIEGDFEILYSGPARFFENESLTNGESYYFKLFSFDENQRYSLGKTIGEIPSPSPMTWITLREGTYVNNMIVAGTRFDGSKDLYVCRALVTHNNGDRSILPGKFVPESKGNPAFGDCFVPIIGKAEEFEVLVSIENSRAVITWEDFTNGQRLTPNSLVAGNSLETESLYICRFRNGEDSYYTPGYTQEFQPCVVDSYDAPNNILEESNFEILTLLAN